MSHWNKYAFTELYYNNVLIRIFVYQRTRRPQGAAGLVKLNLIKGKYGTVTLSYVSSQLHYSHGWPFPQDPIVRESYQSPLSCIAECRFCLVKVASSWGRLTSIVFLEGPSPLKNMFRIDLVIRHPIECPLAQLGLSLAIIGIFLFIGLFGIFDKRNEDKLTLLVDGECITLSR